MLKTKFDEIIDISNIGKLDNPILLNDLLKKANSEKVSPSSEDKDLSLLIAIDVQKDFMESGALGVPGSYADVLRLTKWIYENLEKITQITASIDTHQPFQIFHPCWWIDKNGNNPEPFTAISLKDLDEGIWMATINPIGSRDYIENLEKQGKKVLVIWPYHCIQGTSGHSLENQFTNMMYFHSVARKTIADRMVKGFDPMTEMYGIFKPEYSPKNQINIDALNKLQKFDKIIIAGEAKSHCVLESIRQILEFYQNDQKTTGKIYILEDCMSMIPGFEKATEDAFNDFKARYKVNIVKTTDLKL
jgi:nicotinamidase-related amidase